MENLEEILSYNLRRLRKEKRLTQEELNEAAGLTAGLVQTYEYKRSLPGKTTIVALAKALGVPESTLFADPDLVTVKDPIEALEVLKRALEVLPPDILKQLLSVPENKRPSLAAALRVTIRALLDVPDPPNRAGR